MKVKPRLTVSLLDTVMTFYYIHGLPAREILPYRVQSISHRESLPNLTVHSTSCLRLIQSGPDPTVSQGVSNLIQTRDPPILAL